MTTQKIPKTLSGFAESDMKAKQLSLGFSDSPPTQWLTCYHDNGRFAQGVPLEMLHDSEGFIWVEWDHIMLDTLKGGRIFRSIPTESIVQIEEGYALCSPLTCSVME